MKEAKVSFESIAHKSLDFYNNWDKLERDEKKFVVETITREIIFDGKSVNFKLKQIAPLSSLETSQQRGTML